MPALDGTFGTDVADLTVKFFRRRSWIDTDQAERFFTHMAHSWLVVDVGEAFARLSLELLLFGPRNSLEEGALAIGPWG